MDIKTHGGFKSSPMDSDHALEYHPGVVGEAPISIESIDQRAERRLVLKMHLFIMRMIFFMYFLNAIDRSNQGNAKTDGMGKDLGFKGSQYSVLVMVFYVPFCCLPANLVTRKFQAEVVSGVLHVRLGNARNCVSWCEEFCPDHGYTGFAGDI
jgi:hypothetical protein